MRKLLTLAMVLSVASATAQTIVPINDGQANQNVRDLGMRTIDKGLVIPIWDTTTANQFYSQLTAGQRKEGAVARVGDYLVWFRNGKWQSTSSGGSGGLADGNNYPTSITFNNGIITIQRDGLGPIMSNSLDARYSLSSHTHPISAIIGLSDSLANAGADGNNFLSSVAWNSATGALTFQRQGLANLSVNLDGRYAPVSHTQSIATIDNLQSTLDNLQAQISGGGTAYTGGKGVTVAGTSIALSDKVYTSSDSLKLAGIATNATANQTDAYLLARGNHTGTQTISTVTGLQTALDARLNRSDSNSIYITPYTLTTNHYTKAQSDSRYVQTGSDPVWNTQKTNYSTTSQANALYAPISASYLYGTIDFGQIPVGTGTGTMAGSNSFGRNGGTVYNSGNYLVLDSSKGYGFNVPDSDSTVWLKVDASGNIIRQFVDGNGDTSSSSAVGVDPSQIVTLTGSQTLTNKTLASPAITGTPTGLLQSHISGLVSDLAGKEPTITAPSLTGRYFTGFKTFGVLNTDSVTEGANRLYYTTTRFDSRFNTQLATKTTADLTEGANLYFTNTRARTAISATGTGLSYNNSTGVFTSTALTSETDPVFTASQAFSITGTNKTQWQAGYDDKITTAAFTGTTTKTLTLTQQDGGTVTASFTDATIGGGGTTIASTTNVIKGDGAGNGVAATPGTDYVIPSGTVASATNADNANTVSSIAGLVTAGTNVTRTGSGTSADPYVFSASGGGGGGWTMLTKTADQTNNTTTYATITGLTFSMTSGKTYQVRGSLLYTSSGAGANVQVTQPTTGPFSGMNTYSRNISRGNNATALVAITPGTVSNLGGPTTAPAYSSWFLITINPATSGLFEIQFNTGTAAVTASIKAGSYLEYIEL